VVIPLEKILYNERALIDIGLGGKANVFYQRYSTTLECGSVAFEPKSKRSQSGVSYSAQPNS